MPARQSTSTKWYKLNARNATIEQGPKDNRTEYDEFVGTLVDIEFQEDEYNGSKTFRYLFKFDDGEGSTEILTVSVGTIAACNILNCLDSIDGDIGYLLIRPYVLDELDVAAVYMEHNGEQLDWAHKPADYPDGKKERNRFFHEIFENLQEKLENQETNVTDDLYGNDSEEGKDPVPVGADEPTGNLDNIDDDLPF